MYSCIHSTVSHTRIPQRRGIFTPLLTPAEQARSPIAQAAGNRPSRWRIHWRPWTRCTATPRAVAVARSRCSASLCFSTVPLSRSFAWALLCWMLCCLKRQARRRRGSSSKRLQRASSSTSSRESGIPFWTCRTWVNGCGERWPATRSEHRAPSAAARVISGGASLCARPSPGSVHVGRTAPGRSIVPETKDAALQVRATDPRFLTANFWQQFIWSFKSHHAAPYPAHDHQARILSIP